MAADIKLSWEWPDERQPETYLIVSVESFKKQKNGLFGIGKSPSFVQSFPDPYVLTGTINSENIALRDKSIELVLPKLEAENIRAGVTAVLGVIEDNTCICIKPIDAHDTNNDNVKCE